MFVLPFTYKYLVSPVFSATTSLRFCYNGVITSFRK